MKRMRLVLAAVSFAGSGVQAATGADSLVNECTSETVLAPPRADGPGVAASREDRGLVSNAVQCVGDVTGDGTVDFADILEILGNWGSCPPAPAGPPAPGGFIGLWIEPYVGADWVENGFAGLTALRLYAEFASPDDGVSAVFGATDHPMSVHSSDGFFHNDPVFDSLTAPIDLRPGGTWSNQWDTYVTIGVDDALGDETMLTPGFGEEVGQLAQSFTTENAGWYVFPDVDQGYAGPDRRVLLAQIVIAETESVEGMINVGLYDGSVLIDLYFYYAGWGGRGACCFDDGSCWDFVSEVDCVGEGGTFHAARYCQDVDCTPPCEGDVTGDGVVDFADILLVLSAWGPCP